MLRFFRRRAVHDEVIGMLFGNIDGQIDAAICHHAQGLGSISRSFYVHDYVLGMVLAAVKDRRLSLRDARLGFIDYFECRFGLTRQAAARCFKASSKHHAQDPGGQGFVDGLADAAALLASQESEDRMRRRFAFHTGIEAVL